MSELVSPFLPPSPLTNLEGKKERITAATSGRS